MARSRSKKSSSNKTATKQAAKKQAKPASKTASKPNPQSSSNSADNETEQETQESLFAYPSEYQKKTIWKAITGVALCITAAIIVGFIWLISQLLGFLQPVLLPLALAGVIAYLLDPIVAWLMKKNMSRIKSVLIVFGSFSVLIGIFAMIIIPPIAKQIGDKEQRQKIGNNISSSMEKLGEIGWVQPFTDWAQAEHTDPVKTKIVDQNGVPVENHEPRKAKKFSQSNLGHYLSENTGKILGATKSIITSGTNAIIGTIGLLIGLAMVPIYLYYFLKESAAIKSSWHDYVPLKASHFKDEVVDTLREINGYLIAFFRGQVLVAVIDGFLVGVALWIFRLPYGVVIGLTLAIIGVIPFIGNILCLIPACLIAYVHFSDPANCASHEWLLGLNPWAYVAAVAAIFVIVQQINSLVTAPKIVGESVGLHPMTVIFSMLFWSLILGGFLGALLAVPMTAAVKVLFRRLVWERKIAS